jgi:predicted AAA+ superfamily ATPase
VLLYVVASSSSTITFDSVVSRFGLVITTGDLDEEGFHMTIGQMSEKTHSSEELSAAEGWAKYRGGLTVRNASLYLKEMCK